MESQPTESSETISGRFFRRKTFWKRVLFYGVILVMVLGYFRLIEDSFVYFPSRYPQGDWEPTGLVPEDVFFEAEDGVRLHGWYLSHPEPKGVLLYCHGNAGNLTGRAEVVARLHDRLGVSVFIFDYRGYGRSEGSPSEKGFYRDARAARAWLANREGIDPKEMILLGRSIGGAVAVELAVRNGAKALILQSVFTSVPDVAARYYFWFPVRWVMQNRFNAFAKMGDYRGPLFQSHGDADSLVPLEMGKKLFDAAPGNSKVFYIESGLDHNDSPESDYYESLNHFLNNLDG